MRILLAEDEHTLGTWLSKALEHAGIQVDWVDDGRLADRALQQHDHDALVLDLGLPGLDGHTVLQRLRARDQRLPALILTARDSVDERVRVSTPVPTTSSPSPSRWPSWKPGCMRWCGGRAASSIHAWPAGRWPGTPRAVSFCCTASRCR
jgi:CheY-like chemotaxis protein